MIFPCTIYQSDESEEDLHAGPFGRQFAAFKWKWKTKGCCQTGLSLAVCGTVAQFQDDDWRVAVSSLSAMLGGAACQFCSGSLDVPESLPRRRRLQQLFITASLELLLLYVLNLILIALIVPQEQLKVVPMLVAMFIIGRWDSKKSDGVVKQFRLHIPKIIKSQNTGNAQRIR